jgi:hypothetical protein
MIQTLEIQNFKSIRYLQMDCRRVNLFIGEPNTGKSNILEALGLFSVPHTWEIRDFVRMESMDDLFYEHDISQRVMVRYDGGESSEIWLPDSLKSGHGYTRVSRISTDEICTIRAHPCPIERETKVRRAFTAYQSVSIRSIRVNPCTARSKVSGDQSFSST